jgi:MFS transporter, SP family, general alpha glucoside:H+ symporter
MSSYASEKTIEVAGTETRVEALEDLHITRTAYLEAQQDSLSAPSPPWEVIKANAKTCAVIVAVQTNGIILGLEYVLLGALVGVQAFDKTMGSYNKKNQAYSVAPSTLSLWGGLFGLMQFLGQLFAGWFADRFGRRAGIYLMVFNVYIGVMTEILSQNKNDYTGAKIIMGSATGIMQVVIPTYVAEITPREIRGITIGLFSFNLSLGALIGTFVTYGANQAWGSNPLDNRGWRVPLYVGLAAPTITLVAMLFLLSESPYWLTLKGRMDDAKRSLQSLHPNKSAAEIEKIAQEVQYTVLKERETKESTRDASYLECFRGANLRRTFCALFPSLSQQLVGNQLVQSYSTCKLPRSHQLTDAQVAD